MTTAAAPDRPLADARWRALGCDAHLVVAHPDRLEASLAAVVDVVSAVDLAASRFRTDSELARVNTARGAWTPVSPLFADLLRVALDAAERTGGAVDPTVGRSLLDLGYDRTFRLVPADGPALTVVPRPAPGWRTVELQEGRVRLPDGVLLDLGATAKGRCADLAAEAAAAAGGCGALVSLGGDVAVAGEPPLTADGPGWAVLVSEVAHGDGQTILLGAGGIATSGTAARRWHRGGSLVHHLVDPRSGAPATGPWRTVTVAAGSCSDANAASTAAMVLGDTGQQFLVAAGVPARLVAQDGTVTTTAGWPDQEV